jgi:pre-mRNA-splicing factor ISY1
MYRSIDADYYGYRDDDDGLLVQLEAKAEKEAAEEALEEWKDAQRAKGLDPDMLLRQMGDDVSVAGLPNKKAKLQESFISHVAVPNREDMEKLLVERRKQELMQLLLDAK